MAEKFKAFTQKHGELWKFIKFSFAGGFSSVVELGVNQLCLSFIFAGLAAPAAGSFTQKFVEFLHLETQDVENPMTVFWAYMVSTTIGYTIAFIINRKTTFKADSNVALSATLYVLMVVFTIIANAFIGSYLTKWFGTFWVTEPKTTAETIKQLVIKCIGMAIPTLWTYPLNRFVIHRHKKPEAEVAEAATEEAETKE